MYIVVNSCSNDLLMMFYMYNNIDLCFIILLNFLALVNVNAREEVLTNFGDIKENYMKLGNISRAKRAIVSLCSDINSKPLLPCAVRGRIYELHNKIGKGGCGSVYKGKKPSTSKYIMSRSAKKEYLHLTVIFISP